jgi:Amt family ammonium transporter
VPVVAPKSAEALTGLFYGGGFKIFTAQCVGSLVVCTATFASAMAMFWLLNKVNLLRLSKAGELQGMDIDQHGISAYPEYVISALTAPHGMSRDTVGSGNVPTASSNGETERAAELVGSK